MRSIGRILLPALALVLGVNWWRWQSDRALALRLREGSPIPSLSRTPAVSALVAAWGEGTQVEAHIASFLALRYPAIELIICAGGPGETLERARRHAGPRVTVLEQLPGEGKQRALARCLEHACGEIIYLTDADCLYNDEALTRLLATLVNEGEAVATGGSRPHDAQLGQALPEYLWAGDIYSAAHSPIYIEGLLGRNSALTRMAVERSGGMDFVAPTGTDYHLARRLLAAGLAIRHVPESVVPSDYPTDPAGYWRRQARWLRNLLLYGGQYGAHHQTRMAMRSGGIGALMLALPVAALVGGPWPTALWLSLLAQAVAAKLRYMAFASLLQGRPIGPRRPDLLISLTLLECLIWVTPLLESLSPRARIRW